ncbi:LOW QUALITY PROTEIN: M-phase inducer phosphatase 3 [Erethizon dorsatum]
MCTELLSTREEGSPGSGPSFMSSQRKMLHLLLERNASFTICRDFPKSPVLERFLGDFANLSILSGCHCVHYFGPLDQHLHFPTHPPPPALGGRHSNVHSYGFNLFRFMEKDSNPEHLLGDFSKVCALPTAPGRHRDLKYVNPETVAALLSGGFQDLIAKSYIIDCRYPFEYLGGHIQVRFCWSLNLYSQKELYDFFLKRPIIPLDTQKRIIIVFYSEFSSERGPRTCCLSLSEEDRTLNQYLALYYPDLCILEGGYSFFLEYIELCEPGSYCPVHHQDHQAELLRCGSQSSKPGERQQREQIALLLMDPWQPGPH